MYYRKDSKHKKITSKIAELRQRQQLSQKQLADAINITRQTVIALEKGDYVPSLLLAFKLSEYFNVPIETIFVYD